MVVKKVIIVDDNYEKIGVIAPILREVEGVEFSCFHSSSEALRAMALCRYDLLVTDLRIPCQAGDEATNQGAVELIRSLEFNGRVCKPTFIIGLTAHEEAYDECKEFFEERGWPLKLGVHSREQVESIIHNKIMHSSGSLKSFDVAIITALMGVELDAVLDQPFNWKRCSEPGNGTSYYEGSYINEQGEERSAVLACCADMGIAASATVTSYVCSKFKPRVLVMCGISAGIEGKVSIGDVLISEFCWDWGSGKATIKDDKSIVLNAPSPIHLNKKYRNMARDFSKNQLCFDSIKANWRGGQKPNSSLRLHVGPIATGSLVIEDPSVIERILEQHRKTIGVEMEAFGFCLSASQSTTPPEACLVIKSVSDFAGPTKSDDYQSYAAYTSASSAYEFLKLYV